jgi:hypothetical protein
MPSLLLGPSASEGWAGEDRWSGPAGASARANSAQSLLRPAASTRGRHLRRPSVAPVNLIGEGRQQAMSATRSMPFTPPPRQRPPRVGAQSRCSTSTYWARRAGPCGCRNPGSGRRSGDRGSARPAATGKPGKGQLRDSPGWSSEQQQQTGRQAGRQGPTSISAFSAFSSVWPSASGALSK